MHAFKKQFLDTNKKLNNSKIDLRQLDHTFNSVITENIIRSTTNINKSLKKYLKDLSGALIKLIS